MLKFLNNTWWVSKVSHGLPFQSLAHRVPPSRIFTVLYDTCSVPSRFKENTPTAFQINYWPLRSHYKQAPFTISIALCPHWLKLEARTSCGVNFSHAPTAFRLSTQLPPLVPEDRYPVNTHNGLLLHYTNQQQDRNKQKRNKQANLSWGQSKLSPVSPWKAPVVNGNSDSLRVMFLILRIADKATTEPHRWKSSAAWQVWTPTHTNHGPETHGSCRKPTASLFWDAQTWLWRVRTDTRDLAKRSALQWGPHSSLARWSGGTRPLCEKDLLALFIRHGKGTAVD